MDKRDLAATVTGGILAAATAAEPILQGMNGTMHKGDYVQLIAAILMGVFSWWTKFKGGATQ